jgi:hypothetical protein
MIVPQIGCMTRLLIELAVIAAMVVGFILWQGQRRDSKVRDIALPTNTVLERIHMAGEFVTAVGCVQTVIRSSEVREWLRLQVGTTELLYVGVGQIRAGLNMMELDEQALVVDGDRVTVTLPPCKVLDTKIDVERSYVFDIRKSLVLSPKAIHLQSAAEKDALREIREAAIQAGLLEQAQKQAKMLLRYWFEAAGFRTVEFKETNSALVAPATTTVR